MEKVKARIILTGGHAATTALSVIEEIRSEKLDWDLTFVGSKSAFEGKKIETLEYEVLPGLSVRFLPLTSGRLQRRFTFWTIPSVLKIPVGFLQAFYYLLKIRPGATLSFGGFIAFPVVLASKFFGVPVIIHEQTAAAGRANLASARFADKIALARAESKRYFPGEKVVVTGNPVVKGMFLVKAKKVLGNPLTIFITGGSRGSQSINEVIGVALPKLLRSCRIIHQTGELDLAQFEKIKRALIPDLKRNYQIFGRVNPMRMAKYYEKADIIISRAGANTVSDILAAGRPTILIPLPISFLDEQTKNAEFLAKFGFARVLKQKDLTPEKLIAEVDSIRFRYGDLYAKIEKRESPDKNAAGKVVNLLKECLR